MKLLESQSFSYLSYQFFIDRGLPRPPYIELTTIYDISMTLTGIYGSLFNIFKANDNDIIRYNRFQ